MKRYKKKKKSSHNSRRVDDLWNSRWFFFTKLKKRSFGLKKTLYQIIAVKFAIFIKSLKVVFFNLILVATSNFTKNQFIPINCFIRNRWESSNENPTRKIDTKQIQDVAGPPQVTIYNFIRTRGLLTVRGPSYEDINIFRWHYKWPLAYCVIIKYFSCPLHSGSTFILILESVVYHFVMSLGFVLFVIAYPRVLFMVVVKRKRGG